MAKENINVAVKEGGHPTGVYVFTIANLETKEHFRLNDKITALRTHLNEVTDQWTNEKDYAIKTRLGKQIDREGLMLLDRIRELNRICKTRKEVYKNIVPTVGRQLIVNNLFNASPTNLILCKWAEVGTGTNAPANADTALQTSTYRNAIASRTNAANIGYASAFFNATETTGTYREAGIFCDGTSSQGSGVLLSRVAINITKTSSQTLTIDWTFTLS